MKTLNQFADEVLRYKNSPHELAEVNIEMAVKYARLSELMKDVLVNKAVFWNMKFENDKLLSDAYIDAKWKQEDDGLAEIRLKQELKSLEKLMSAAKSSLVNATVELKNLG